MTAVLKYCTAVLKRGNNHGEKEKDTMELRFYEVPQGEYVLALLGDNWIRDYGHDESNLHFHNLMEIGYCKNGTGELILNEETNVMNRQWSVLFRRITRM